MRLEIVIRMDNAAFDDGEGGKLELADILEELVRELKRGGDWDDFTGENAFHDSNGNAVGSLTVKDEA